MDNRTPRSKALASSGPQHENGGQNENNTSTGIAALTIIGTRKNVRNRRRHRGHGVSNVT